jgi:hypothetical protein
LAVLTPQIFKKGGAGLLEFKEKLKALLILLMRAGRGPKQPIRKIEKGTG